MLQKLKQFYSSKPKILPFPRIESVAATVDSYRAIHLTPKPSISPQEFKAYCADLLQQKDESRTSVWVYLDKFNFGLLDYLVN